jgi:maltose O-acetyltransferase
MRRLWWRVYVAYLRLRGVRVAARACFHCHEKLRIRILRALGADIGHGTRIRGPFHIMGRFDDFSGLHIGTDTYVGPDCLVDLSASVHIGDRAAVSARCSFVTHLNVGPGRLAAVCPERKAGISVGDDAWIGLGATILMGVSLGSAAMVGAGAVVNTDVKEHVLVAGIPAREIKHLDDNPPQSRPA